MFCTECVLKKNPDSVDAMCDGTVSPFYVHCGHLCPPTFAKRLDGIKMQKSDFIKNRIPNPPCQSHLLPSCYDCNPDRSSTVSG